MPVPPTVGSKDIVFSGRLSIVRQHLFRMTGF